MSTLNPLATSGLTAVSGSTTTSSTSVGQDAWLALANRGTVIVRPPPLTVINQNFTGAWWICGPNGEQVDTTGTTTQGLQEAINYAVSHGYPLRVLGHASRNPYTFNDPTTYPPIFFTQTTLSFPPMFLQDIDISNCTIQYVGGGSAPVMQFDSCMMTRVRIGGQILGNGSGPSVLLKPTNNLPIDVQTTITAARFDFGSLGSVGGGGTSLLDIDCSFGSFITNSFLIHELECINAFTNGFRIIGVGSLGGTTGVVQNQFDIVNAHGFTGVGLQIGGASTAFNGLIWGQNIRGNIFKVPGLRGGGAAAQGINCFGNYNTFIGGEINGEEGGLLNGILTSSNDTAAGGNKNTFLGFSVRDNAGAAYTDGTGNNFKFGGSI